MRILCKVTVHMHEAGSKSIVCAHANLLHKCAQRQTGYDAEPSNNPKP